jgi:hypothetical protein
VRRTFEAITTLMPELERRHRAVTGGGYPPASGRSPIPGSPATCAGQIEPARERDAMVLRRTSQGLGRHGIERR